MSNPDKKECGRCWGTGLALPVCIRNCAFTIIDTCPRCKGSGVEATGERDAS